MAYFSNGTEASVFEEECSKCAFGQDPCPIAFVQMMHNYEVCNNPVAKAILDTLIRQGGKEERWKYKGCAMKELMNKKGIK